MSEYGSLTRAKSFIAKHPVLLVIVLGLAIRAILIPFFTHSYDVYHWAITISNLRSGEGLYGLVGYYYTPVWGYILAGIGSLADLIGIADFGNLVPSLTFVNGSEWEYYRELVCTPAFVTLIKVIFTVFDLITGYLIYVLVKDHTNDKKKATMAFGLWFLCPIVIYTSAVHVMFDTIAVMALVLTLLLIFRRRYVLAGAVFAISVFIKFFPFYLIFIFLALILRQERTTGYRNKAVLMAVFGFLAMVVAIYIPQIVDGTIMDTFDFVFLRIDDIDVGNVDSDTWTKITSIGYALVLLLQAVTFSVLAILAWKIYKSPEEGSEFTSKFMLFLMLSSAVIFLWTPTPTYLMIILPFLAYVAVTREDKYIVPYVLISVSAFLFAIFMHNYSIFFQMHGYSDIIPLDMLTGGIGWFDTKLSLASHRTLVNVLLGAFETLSIYSIYLFAYKAHRKKKTKAVTA